MHNHRHDPGTQSQEGFQVLQGTPHVSRAALLLIALLVWALLGTSRPMPGLAAVDGHDLTEVVVLTEPGAARQVLRQVQQLGGTVGVRFATLHGFSARLPAAAVAVLQSASGVRAVTPDRQLHLQSTNGRSYDPTQHHGSLWWLGELTGAHELWRRGFTGQGIDIALIDSGVVPVPGLADESRVLHGPDVSLEAVHDDLRHLDSYGHGTHLAGIIAASDPRGIDPDDPDRIQGLAPGSRLISIKAAEQRGVADVTQIIAAIDWVIANRNKHGLNIRVLNLAFATDSLQGATLDPLSFAVEQAWRNGIVVVTAAGNGGNGTSSLPLPAANPFVIAVGATDGHDNADPSDDTVATYSNRGSQTRRPDVVAPGTHIVSLRSPGSYLDETYPGARIGGSMFRGSGTSQAAAAVSGLAALLIQQHPGYTPDQILYLLTSTAQSLSSTSRRLQGEGAVDGAAAADRSTLGPALFYTQVGVPATGLGTLDGARGTLQVVEDGIPLVGQQDIFGHTFDAATWIVQSAAGLAFGSDGTWNGNRWAGDGWEGNRWASGGWAGNRWAGNRWADDTWAGNTWEGNRWAGDGWQGNRWATGDWSAERWSTSEWG